MRYFLTLAMVVVLLVSVTPAVFSQSGDEAAIRKASKIASESLNGGDVKAHADVYAVPFETFQETQGRATHEKNHKETIEHDKSSQRQRKMLDEINLVFLTPEMAIHKYRQERTGGLDDDGKSLPPAKTIVARVYVKEGGKWLTRAVFTTPIVE